MGAHGFKTKAHAFLIWRYAEPRDWDVTYEEIAEATNLTKNQVEAAIKFAGYGGKIGIGGGFRSRSRATTKSHFYKGYDVDVNALELTDLIKG